MTPMKETYLQLIQSIGEDPNREGLIKTPERAAKAMAYLTHGYDISIESIIGDALFTSDNDSMVIVKNIEFYSLCEHHMLPFWGQCHVGYLPNGKVLGLSKIPRLVDCFSRRLQIQENLTKQIADTLMDITGASGVGVVMEGQHMCMMMRGVSKQNAQMTTSSMLGKFRESANTRQEFLQLIRAAG